MLAYSSVGLLKTNVSKFLVVQKIIRLSGGSHIVLTYNRMSPEDIVSSALWWLGDRLHIAVTQHQRCPSGLTRAGTGWPQFFSYWQSWWVTKYYSRRHKVVNILQGHIIALNLFFFMYQNMLCKTLPQRNQFWFD